MQRGRIREQGSYCRVALLVLGCLACLLVGCSGSGSGGPAASPPAATGPATPVPPASSALAGTVSYHVVGARILDNQGHVFIPYGVHLVGLSVPGWEQSMATEHLTFDQMVAVRHIWHANTVSIQLASADLFAVAPYDPAYLAKVDQEVTWAHEEGMNILLVLQYEDTTGQPLPTEDTVHFWDFMSRHYRHDPGVFFDVFNEPLLPSLGGDSDAAWQIWQNGGDGYVGMQQLVDTIRKNGAQNLIFVQGLCAGECLDKVPAHRLHGGNIVYAIHPYFGPVHLTPQSWDHYWGTVAATAGLPVVADEWGEYQSTKGECVPQAPTLVPQFLAYLHAHGIGLIAWALAPGVLIRGWNYADPTAFDQPTYTCGAPFPNFDPHAQGAGQLIMQYFATNNP